VPPPPPAPPAPPARPARARGSPHTTLSGGTLTTRVDVPRVLVAVDAATGDAHARPVVETFTFESDVTPPRRLGLLLVGLGGNNGSTLAAALALSSARATWPTKSGARAGADWLGSLTQSSTVRVGATAEGADVYVPFSKLFPLAEPRDVVLGGWDISALPLASAAGADALARAAVLDVPQQAAARALLAGAPPPLRAAFEPGWLNANQGGRADNVLPGGDKAAWLAALRADIRAFRAAHALPPAGALVVVWTASTERLAPVRAGLNATADELLAAIARSDADVPPSQLYAVAAALEGAAFVNGAPQNTLVPGVVELADACGTHVAGDDFKTGQTKLKSVLVEFLCAAGIAPASIVSYNHLGNADGANLSAEPQFKSKEASKAGVVEDAVAASPHLFPRGPPDHVIVIKYVPAVGDTKRALDEYECRILNGGRLTLALNARCEDSLLAAPLILDLALLAEGFSRVRVGRGPPGGAGGAPRRTHAVLSLLGALLKAPAAADGALVVNGFTAQREALVNFLKHAVGLPPDTHVRLADRLARAPGAGGAGAGAGAGAGGKAAPAGGGGEGEAPGAGGGVGGGSPGV